MAGEAGTAVVTDDTICNVLDRYEQVLGEMPRHRGDDVDHLLTMIPKMRDMLDHIAARSAQIDDGPIAAVPGLAYANRNERAKLMRWLGFLQGALWVKGIYTIDEMRAHNKPEGEPFAPKDGGTL